MTRYVAFLRAINVGGNVVKMDQLRGLFESLGFADVETFIASGNVIFESPVKKADALERKIEAHLHKALRYEVATFLRTPAELKAATARTPFGGDAPGAGETLFIAFLKETPSDEPRRRLMALQNEVDRLHVAGRELYWLRRGGSEDSKLSGAMLERALKGPATARNMNTINKIVAKWSVSRD